MDWGNLPYLGKDGRKLIGSYVGLVRRADTAAFIQCHVNPFEYLNVLRHQYLYAKVATQGRERRKGSGIVRFWSVAT